MSYMGSTNACEIFHLSGKFFLQIEVAVGLVSFQLRTTALQHLYGAIYIKTMCLNRHLPIISLI